MNKKTNEMQIRQFIEDYLISPIKQDVYEKITFRKNIDLKDQTRVYADPKFQRKYGAWTTKKKSAFIESLFLEKVFSPIVLAECTKTYRENTNLGHLVKWTILDGQHRSHVIKEFINDEFGFTGYTSDGDRTIFRRNQLFSNLPPREQEMFLRSEIEIKTISDVSEDRYREIFIAINDGEALNYLEKLNAFDCEMSDFSRSLAEIHNSSFEKISSVKKDLQRMSGNELICKMYIFALGTLSSTPNIGGMYDHDIQNLHYDSNGEKKYMDEDAGDYVKDLLNSFDIVTTNYRSKKVIQMKHLWCYFIIHSIVQNKFGLSYGDISDSFTDETLWNFSKSIHDQLWKASKKDEGKDELAENKQNYPYFHKEIGRFHVSQSSNIVFNKISKKLGSKAKLIAALQAFEFGMLQKAA